MEETTDWGRLQEEFAILIRALPGIGTAEKQLLACKHRIAYCQGFVDANLTYQPELERQRKRIEELERLLNGK